MDKESEHLKSLNTAALVVTCRRYVHRAAFSSLLWGTLSCGIAWLALGWNLHAILSTIVGLFLIAEGITIFIVQRKVIAMLFETFTLLALGIYDLVLFAIGLHGGEFAGTALFFGLGMTFGAIVDYSGYQTYKKASADADPQLIQSVQREIEDLVKAKLQDSPDIVELKIERRLKPLESWRIGFRDGRVLTVHFSRDSFRWHAQEAFFLPRKDVRAEFPVEYRLEKHPRANVRLGEVHLEKASLDPSMYERLQRLAP